ncbi:MAG: hypothetical protein IKD24_08885 [Alistipes sp.]|nr:hypothetical protein [Alistipes sp.]
MVKKIINAIKYFVNEPCCAVGFIDPIEIMLGTTTPRVNWIKGTPKDRWYADPFILEVSDTTIHVLVERFKYKDNKGVLSRLEICRKDNRLMKETVILELPTHLSFPFIYEEYGKTYIIPENYQSGALSIYEYDRNSDSLVNPQVLINEPLVDAVCKKIGESYFIFAIKYCDDFREAAKILYIYRSSQLKGEYSLVQTISYDKAEARGAGNIIEVAGKNIKVSQDCEGGYGRSVIFSELNFSGIDFNLKEVARLVPSGGRYSEGLHTYNHKDGITIVDGIGYRRGVLSKLLNRIYKSIKVIK